MKLRSPWVRRVPGFVDGTFEDIEPAALEQKPGALDSGKNFFQTPTGQLGVRGGSQVKLTLTDDQGSPANVTSVQIVQTHTPVGAIAVAHSTVTNKSYLYTLTSVPALINKYNIAAWAGATRRTPVFVEMFELAYLCDANPVYSSRVPLLKFDHGTGTFTTINFNLGGGAADLKSYVIEHYNGVLLAAGHDGASGGNDEPAILRASFLGTEPAAANGFTANSYALVGSRKQRITALRSGRGLCLVAKANELWKVVGAGQARDSWNYTIDQVDATEGQGCANPYALEFAEGYWYGIGDAGPWRSDGMTVENLVGPRQRSWRGVQNLTNAFVAHHPDRRSVLFGFNSAPVDSGRSATYPYVLWTWDIDRENWGPNHKFSADLSFVAPIRTTTVVAPTAPPTIGTPTHSSATTTSVVVNWTNGDATADTEVWYKDETGGGSWTIFSVKGPGVTTETITGLSQRKNYKVKCRHLKGGVHSVYSGEADAYTKLATPTGLILTDLFHVISGLFRIEVTQNAGISDLIIEKDGTPITTFSNQSNGQVSYDSTGNSCGVTYTFRARSFLSAWPAAIQYSDYVTDTIDHPC